MFLSVSTHVFKVYEEEKIVLFFLIVVALVTFNNTCHLINLKIYLKAIFLA